jgi:glutamine synthetase
MARSGDALAGRISLDELERAIRGGEIDTVVNAVTDMQGRLMGKRITGDFFLENGRHGTHFCTYLLATDMEMATPAGYNLANWETGYGDWLADPDWSTLRAIPWLEKTALVLSDAKDEATGELIPIAPRTILKRQVERAKALGLAPKMASELEFYVLKETYEQAAEKGFQGLTPFATR